MMIPEAGAVGNSQVTPNPQHPRGFVRNAVWAGLDVKAIEKLEEECAAEVDRLVNQPEVWRAVLALADTVQTKKRIEGAEVARIVTEAMKTRLVPLAE